MSIQQQQQQKRLGVIGGLGPLATAYFYELITLFTEVTREQEHLEILLFSRPAIPDRTAAILRSEERRVGKECRSRWSPYH